MQAAFLEGEAEKSGHALQARFAQKWDKYGEACQAQGMCFLPLPIEVLGGFHEAGVHLVKRLGQDLARSSGQEDSSIVKHLFGRLAVLLQRGNSQLMCNRLPQPSAPNINGIQ